jgi:protocatechuate 3,4-dioxygenase beta subunit
MRAKTLVPVTLLMAVLGVTLVLLIRFASEQKEAPLEGDPLIPSGGQPAVQPPADEPGPPQSAAGPSKKPDDPAAPGTPSDAEPAKPSSVLSGSVVEEASDRPLEGMSVRVYPTGERTPVAETRTDGEGRFRIQDLDVKLSYLLCALGEGFAEARVKNVLFESGVPELELPPIRLRPGGTLRGVVASEQGELLKGAEVILHPLKETSEGLTYPDRTTPFFLWTDDRGLYESTSLPPARYRVMAQAQGFARSVRNGVEVSAGKTAEADFTLRPACEVSGTVRDMAGKPIPGAQVTGSFRGEGGPFEIPPSVAAEDGTFSLSHMPPGTCNLVANAEGFAEQIRISVPIPSRNVEFALGRTSGIIEGRVEGPSGPLDDFQIKYYEEKPGNYQLAAVAILKAKTKEFKGAQGVYRIENLAAGAYSVEAHAEGCLGGARAGVKLEEGGTASGIDFRLGKAHPLRGKVLRKADKLPVAGAEVVVNLVIKGPFGEIPFAPSDVKTKTDETGAFEITRLKEGTLSISVTHPEYGKTSRSGIPIKAGEPPAEQTFLVEPGGRIAGQVRGPDGQGVFGDYVVIQNPGDPSNRLTLESGKDGRYTSELLAPGPYQVIRVDRADTTKVKVKWATVKSGETTTVDFGEVSGCRLHGTVTSSGSPVPGCTVSIVKFGAETEERNEMGVATTNEKGEYEIQGVQPGKYYVFAQTGQEGGTGKARTVRMETEVTSDDLGKRVDIVFPSGAIAGTAVDAAGKPVAGATVIVMQADAPDVRSFEEILSYYGGQTLTDETGTFEVGGLRPGAYNVEVVKEGFAHHSVGPRELSAGQTLRLALTLVPEAHVTGRITRSDGTPVKDAALYLLDEHGKPADFTFGTTFSDADGTYDMKRVGEGTYTILVEAPGCASAVTSVLTVPRAGTVQMDVTLKPESRIVLRATRAGAPVTGAVVRVFSASGEEVVDRINERNMYTSTPDRKTGADGVLAVGKLAAGTYRLEVTESGGAKKSVDVAVGEAATTAVDVVFE